MMREDITQEVRSEWRSGTSPLERVRSVMRRSYDGHTVEEIAERAIVNQETADKHLCKFTNEGFVEEIPSSESDESIYRRSPISLILENARDIAESTDTEILEAKVAEMESELETDSSSDLEWRTTYRNLQFVRVALELSRAENSLEEFMSEET